MARPLRIQYPGSAYHITNRGNERKAIFGDDNDSPKGRYKVAGKVVDIFGNDTMKIVGVTV